MDRDAVDLQAFAPLEVFDPWRRDNIRQNFIEMGLGTDRKKRQRPAGRLLSGRA
jgi:hypothetical protein